MHPNDEITAGDVPELVDIDAAQLATGPADPAHSDSHVDAHEPASRQDSASAWTPEAVDRLDDLFSAAPGVSPEVRTEVRAWCEQTYAPGAAPPDGKIAHAYDLRQFEFSDRESPYVTSFANGMAANGATQAEVVAALNWYADMKGRAEKHQGAQALEMAAVTREIEEQDRRESANNTHAMREIWGTAYSENMRRCVGFLKSLSRAEREHILGEVVDGGVTLKLNTPRGMAALLERAERQAPRVSAGESTAAKPLPTSSTAINSEIAEIEAFMRRDRRAYNKDEAKQARYLELLRTRDR